MSRQHETVKEWDERIKTIASMPALEAALEAKRVTFRVLYRSSWEDNPHAMEPFEYMIVLGGSVRIYGTLDDEHLPDTAELEYLDTRSRWRGYKTAIDHPYLLKFAVLVLYSYHG